MENVIQKLSKQTKVSEKLIQSYMEDITMSLIKEGCPPTDPKFHQYLLRRVRKRLKIEESPTYKTFKQFFKPN